MMTNEELEVLKQLSYFEVNDFEALKKLQRKRAIEKLGFSEEQADLLESMKENEEKRLDYERELLAYFKRKPQKQAKFFKENNINYETIFQMNLLMLVEQTDLMTPAKIVAFKEYKNQCLRLKYNHSSEEKKELISEEYAAMYLERFGGYLNHTQEEQINLLVKSRVEEVEFESVNTALFAKEILSCLDIEYELKTAKLALNKSLVVNILKRERKPINLFSLKNKISYFVTEGVDVQACLVKLFKEGFIKYIPEGIQYYIPTIEEYIENNKEHFLIIDARLKGATLEMIGEGSSVTRERIRQKEKAQLQKIPKEELFETRYLNYFTNYEMTPEEFCQIFSLNEYQYRFLNLYHKKEKELMTKEALMESDKLTFKEREQLEIILNQGFLVLGNKKIRNKKIDLIEYLIEIYAQKEILRDDFYSLVREFNEKNNLEFDFSSDRAIDSVVIRANNVLLKYGRRMVHYKVEKEDVLEKISMIDFSYFMNQEITARKILDAYQIPLNQIDIYDEYELHNLLKKYSDSLPEYVNLTRMPFIEIGKANREEQVLNLLIELSPIDVDDFVLAYSERYGAFERTIRANFLTVIEEFKTEETYVADMPTIDSQLITNLETMLVNEFYFKEDIQKMYEEEHGDWQIPDFIFRKVGYKNYTEFILKDHFNRADLYFEEEYFNKEMFDVEDKRLYLLGSFRKKLEQKQSEFTIFQYAKDSYINISKLTKFADVQRSDVMELLEQIDDYIGDRYFTFSNIEFLVEKSKLNELGFDSLFYESILRGANHYRFQNLGGTTLFKKTKDKFYSYDLMEDIVSRYKSIDIYDLIDLLDEKYSIKLPKEKVLSACMKRDLYFNPIMEMVYLDVDEFYEMMGE